ncbi:MAG: RNA methyltransferase [Desulfovibrionales bacterium]
MNTPPSPQDPSAGNGAEHIAETLKNLSVVLFRTKLPENIGGVARACVNMGCSSLVLVQPRQWDVRRAEPMATYKGAPLLWNARIHDHLSEALKPFSLVFGTTARTGGWRKGIVSAEAAAERIVSYLAGDKPVAVVFGPEDFGLTNEEIELCGPLITIPTSPGASSLNLAQAVLVVLYECLKRTLSGVPEPVYADSELISWEERERLYAWLKRSLLDIDYLKKDNPDYWMLAIRRFLNKTEIQRHEYNMLMGICRQVRWITGNARRESPPESD